MRLLPIAALLVAAVASCPATASAQAAGGSCATSGQNAAGTSPSASFTLAVLRNGNYVTLPTTVIQNVLDIAECQCDSQDLYLQALITKSITVMPAPTFSVWEGSSCTAQTTRTSTCEDVSSLPGAAKPADFTQGISTGIPRQQVHVQPLVSPKTTSTTTGFHQCVSGTISNSVWLLFGDQTQPDYCSVQLSYYGTAPSLPTGVSAGSGDEAVTISWTPPGTGDANRPTFYQVLCAVQSDDHTRFVPAANQGGGYAFGEDQHGHELAYSTCIDPTSHNIQRKYISTSGSAGVADAGVASGDMAGQSEPIGSHSLAGAGTVRGQDNRISPEDSPADAAAEAPAVCLPLATTVVLDMATTPVVDLSTPVDLIGADFGATDDAGGAPADLSRAADLSNAADLGTGLTVTTLFPHLDKSFVCSDKLSSTTTSIRIGGLQNNVPHYFTVVAIDAFGNASTTDPVCAVPHFVDDAYRRFLESGGKPQGFCFIATAAFGSYQSPFVMILRDFRDQVLAPTDTGARFIGWYYRTSPPIADWIRPRAWARWAVRTALWPVILAVGLWMWISPTEALLVTGLLLALWYGRRQRRRQPETAPERATLVTARSPA